MSQTMSIDNNRTMLRAAPQSRARNDLLSGLRALMPDERIIADPAELFVYESDGFTIAKSRPAAVVFATTTEEVVPRLSG